MGLCLGIGVGLEPEVLSFKPKGFGVLGVQGIRAGAWKQNGSSIPRPTLFPTRGKVGGPLLYRGGQGR